MLAHGARRGARGCMAQKCATHTSATTAPASRPRAYRDVGLHECVRTEAQQDGGLVVVSLPAEQAATAPALVVASFCTRGRAREQQAQHQRHSSGCFRSFPPLDAARRSQQANRNNALFLSLATAAATIRCFLWCVEFLVIVQGQGTRWRGRVACVCACAIDRTKAAFGCSAHPSRAATTTARGARGHAACAHPKRG